MREDILDMLALNVRFPRDFRGDLAAMIGAATSRPEKRIGRLNFADVGTDTVSDAIEAILDGAERQSRAIVESWKGTASITARRCSTMTGVAAPISRWSPRSPSGAAISKSI